MRVRATPLLAALLVVAPAAAADAEWRIELALGGAHSFGSSLRVEQEGQPELAIAADWATRSFESPFYYALRVARGDARGAWALRFVHHKVHLENTTAEVERFGVSHGYNMLTLERSFALRASTSWRVWAW